MKEYITPELKEEHLELVDIITASFGEGSSKDREIIDFWDEA